MTDKEQIIIDGVDILKEKINMCFILLLNKLETPETIEQTIYDHLETFVKEWNTQLARKTQECEQKQNIIEEIEEYCKKCQILDLFGLASSEKILDIINKKARKEE